jgi:CxxC motif-containing protein
LSEERHFICVTCPVGCSIVATVEGQELIAVRGQGCKQGISFVQEEMTAPKRMLTTTVQVVAGALPLVPVRSTEPLPKENLLAVAKELRDVVLRAPISEHQVVIENVLDTGVDIVTSRALEARHRL